MAPLRRLLLACSESAWLHQRAPHWRFVRTAVARFMPGERVEDALTAASVLRERGIGAVLTLLGENVTDAAKAAEITRHYADVLEKSHASGLDCHISLKPTQLGLDVDDAQCFANLRSLVVSARRLDTFVWIDMERHTYVDRTLDIYRRMVAEFPNVGVCLQSYLYRTADDLRSLIRLGGGIRLVKGAYREPAAVAYPRKRDVDANFVALAEQMIAPAARAAGLRAVFGTHDHRILDRLKHHIERESGSDASEFHLLFGIRPEQQLQLARDGYRVRVLISYGDQWFPWYMRRLAERPANVLFVARAIWS